MRIKKQANPEGRLWRDRVDRCGRRRDQQRARKSSVEPPEATPLLLRSFDVLPWQHDVPHQHERTFWALYVTGGRRTQQMHSHSHMRTHSTNSWSLLHSFFLFFFWGVGVLKGGVEDRFAGEKPVLLALSNLTDAPTVIRQGTCVCRCVPHK